MADKTLDYQANVYVYDLNNCAREHGFKEDDVWVLNLASVDEKKALEKKYMPTISVKALPEFLSQLGHAVRDKLIQAKSSFEKQLSDSESPGNDLQYLVAYSPKRFR
ncbi:hypothetical protein DJ568_00895 [Mucilaginibacter hurinus]|uniref:Uncharacterized protein n=1 Tax=Mucilaginibacter hurinus TaxID=2201324 RepID=A0A367GTD2_9SPHI|nr:hypothetical protein [Mucilaginibacter hurinus]RCH56448.1 hypothetical protein DJ568_00895 [Mucilaginibacter hurinus]